jgi:hypothetical protein
MTLDLNVTVVRELALFANWVRLRLLYSRLIESPTTSNQGLRSGLLPYRLFPTLQKAALR